MYYPTCIEYIKLAPSYTQKIKCGCWEEKVVNVEKGSPQPQGQGVDGDVWGKSSEVSRSWLTKGRG